MCVPVRCEQLDHTVTGSEPAAADVLDGPEPPASLRLAPMPLTVRTHAATGSLPHGRPEPDG